MTSGDEAKSLTELVARDVMTQPVISLRADSTLRESARVLIENRIQGAPVVDDRAKVVGVLSVTDLARYQRERDANLIRESDYYHLMEAGGEGGVPWEQGFHLESDDPVRVRDVMTPSVISVGEETALSEIVQIILKHGVHRVVVLREASKALVGVVSETDVLRAVQPTLSGPQEAGA